MASSCWDPVPAVAAVVGQERAEHFVHGDEFDFWEWNHAQDAGRSWADAEAAATASHPDLTEEIPPTGLTSLSRCGGWSLERPGYCGPSTPRRTAGGPDELVSGDDPPRARGLSRGLCTLRRHRRLRRGRRRQARPGDLPGPRPSARAPDRRVFYVDDTVRNVTAARTAGMDAVRFPDAASLLTELQVAAFSTDTVATRPRHDRESPFFAHNHLGELLRTTRPTARRRGRVRALVRRIVRRSGVLTGQSQPVIQQQRRPGHDALPCRGPRDHGRMTGCAPGPSRRQLRGGDARLGCRAAEAAGRGQQVAPGR